MSTAANLVTSVADTAPASDPAQRALFWSAANNFQKGQPDVPCHVFVAERDRAIDEGTGTALIPLDLSDRLGLDYPATVPNLLARYVRVAGGDEIAFELASSGEAYYVMEGSGEGREGRRAVLMGGRGRVRAAGRRGSHAAPGRRGRNPPLDGDRRAGARLLRG